MKIIIVTMCDYNYGSQLQAYALQKVITRLGYVCQIVDRGKVLHGNLLLNFHGFGIKNLLNFLGVLLYGNSTIKSYRASEHFVSDELQLTLYRYKTYADLLDSPPKADMYIVGSDQVWNPISIKPEFFLEFVPESICKISYAASVGISTIPDSTVDYYKRILSRFEAISVREEDAKRLLVPITNKEIDVHVDPTLLLSKEDWIYIENKVVNLKSRYILCYILYKPTWLDKRLRELHERTKLDIVVVYNTNRRIYHNRFVRTAGPKEFVWLVNHAEAIVTSSFHGTIFSILFNKPFVSIVNSDKPSRISNLLEKFDLQSAIINDQKIEFNNIDYTSVNKVIQNEIKRSIDYLEKNIQKAVQNDERHR